MQTDKVTSYIHFCLDPVIPNKFVKCFSNKSLVTRDVKIAFNWKISAFASRDKNLIKTTQRDIKRAIRQGEYKQKMEGKF